MQWTDEPKYRWVFIGMSIAMLLQAFPVLYFAATSQGFTFNGHENTTAMAITLYEMTKHTTTAGVLLNISNAAGNLFWLPLIVGVYLYAIGRRKT